MFQNTRNGRALLALIVAMDSGLAADAALRNDGLADN